MEIPQSVIAILTGLVGVLFGTSLSSYFNLKSARKDLLFKRKLEYFEKLAKDLEENFRLHKSHIMSISKSTKKAEISNLLNELKKNRKNFLLGASPLYLNVEIMTKAVTNVVNIEKRIFALLELMVKAKSSLSKERIIYELRKTLEKLNGAEQMAILEMRRELYQR